MTKRKLSRNISTDRNLIWFHLYDSYTDQPFKGTSVSSVLRSSLANVNEFKHAVKAEYPNKLSSVDASQLRVYKNKNSFDKRDADVGQVNQAMILSQEGPLKSSGQLDRLGESEDDALIVAVGSTVKAVWKTNPKFVYSIYNCDLFFVNREIAIQQLNEIHRSKYKKANLGCGENWEIPLVDNVSGIGKSAFAGLYIDKTREQWKDSIENGSLDDFQKTLCACHTIHIIFSIKALISDDFDVVLLKHFQLALNDKFVVPPVVLSDPPKDTVSFLERLVKEAGPVFIVLDGIGEAFDTYGRDTLANDNFKTKEKFMHFCSTILQKWQTIPKVFFLLAGSGFFLSYVHHSAERLGDRVDNFQIHRLSLTVMREDSIKTILKRTRMVDTSEKSVQEHFGMNEEQLSIAAKRLFITTNGLPRALLRPLQNCNSFSELVNDKGEIQIPSWKGFFAAIERFKSVLPGIVLSLDDGSSVDLTELYEDADGQKITFDIIAHLAYIDWDGTVSNARLYTHPYVKTVLENYVFPLKEYLRYFGDTPRESIDYQSVFEWMCLKRFQEIFSTPQNPKQIIPSFFETAIFGNLNGLSFSSKTRPMADRYFKDLGFDIVDEETKSPNDWSVWSGNVDCIGKNTCLKPRVNCITSNAFLLSETVIDEISYEVMVNLSISNCGKMELTERDILGKCDLFNRMFYKTQRQRKNFLFICGTNYSNDIVSKFNGKLFQVYKKNDKFKNIHEVIILDLTTPENRASFFDTDNHLSTIVECIVASRSEI